MKYPGINPVFFVGASAGGVESFMKLAEQLPADFPAPIFFLLHRKREGGTTQDLLADILSTKSKLKVTVAKSGDIVRAGHLYVAPLNRHVVVEDNQIYTPELADDANWRPSIDVLFKSGSREYRERAVCILLTGLLEDGVEGLKETTFQGGVTVAQSPEDAYCPHLPLSALLEDHPSYVLPLADMGALLCELAGHKAFEKQREITKRAAQTAVYKKEQLKKEISDL